MTISWHAPESAMAYGTGTPLPASAPARAIDAQQPASDYSEEVVILGRLKPGLIRESRRVVHVFLAAQVLHATAVTARCGARLLVADTQWLPTLIGMPCEHCILHALAAVTGSCDRIA